MKKSISTQPSKANIATILKILSESPQQLSNFSAKLSAKQARLPVGEGERSFIENLAHIINCETLSSQAICLALMLNQRTPLA